MTPTQRQAMEQALAVLDALCEAVPAIQPTADSIRAALAETAEPVAWVECDGELVWSDREAAIGRNLYTTPQPPAPAVELTDEELPPLPDTAYQLYYEWPDDEDGYGGSEVVDADAYTTDQMREFARAAIAAHEAKRGKA